MSKCMRVLELLGPKKQRKIISLYVKMQIYGLSRPFKETSEETGGRVTDAETVWSPDEAGR